MAVKIKQIDWFELLTWYLCLDSCLFIDGEWNKMWVCFYLCSVLEDVILLSAMAIVLYTDCMYFSLLFEIFVGWNLGGEKPK